MSSKSKPQRALLLSFAALEFIVVVDFMVVMPLGPSLIRDFEISASAFGALVSAYTLASAIVGLIASTLLDRFARGPALLSAFAVFMAATLLCGLAPNYATLLVARALAGACAGVTSALMHAALADLIPTAERGRAMSVIASAFGVSAIAGVPLSLVLADVAGTRAPFVVLTAVGVFVLLGLFRVLPKRFPRSETTKAFAPAAIPASAWFGLLLISSVLAASFLIIPFLGTHFAQNFGVKTSELSLLYAVAGGTTLLISRWVGAATDHFGKELVLATLLVGSALTHWIITHLTKGSLASLGTLFTLLMVLTSSRQIPLYALLAELAEPERRARFMAHVTVCRDATAAVAAFVAARMLHTTSDGKVLGFAQVGAASVVMSVCALLLLGSLVRLRKRTTSPVIVS